MVPLILLALRKCNLQNLNLSPLCNLDSNSFSYLWRGDVVDLYSDRETVPDYVNTSVSDAYRPVYNNPDLALKDILTNAGKVNSLEKCIIIKYLFL